jgi:outer membrane protein
LNLLRAKRDANYQFAKAEDKLNAPTVSLLAAGGVVPEHDHTIPHDNYEALGVNVNIPIFNGGLFAGRKAEAKARAQASDKDVQDLSIEISRDVRTAWLDANTAFRRLSVTSQLVDQARKAVHLAEARYNAGLGSIVELNQAQVSEISAEIDAASAKYEYLGRRTALDFAVGALH